MTLADPRTALNELVTAITALKLPIAYGDPLINAFDHVRVFDLSDLAKAMEELFVYANRICLIGVNTLDHAYAVSGRNLRIERTLDLTCILSDRRFSDRQKAMMGDASTTPGALQLAKILVDGLAGELTSGAVCIPDTGRLVALENEKRKDETGRILFAQDFTIALDWQAANLSRAAKIAPTQ